MHACTCKLNAMVLYTHPRLDNETRVSNDWDLKCGLTASSANIVGVMMLTLFRSLLKPNKCTHMQKRQ